MDGTVVCMACRIAAIRLQATYAKLFFTHATYGNEVNEPFVDVVKAARRVYGQAVKQLELTAKKLPHVCSGNPERCQSCGMPLLGRSFCGNLFCGMEPPKPEDWRQIAQLVPQDQIGAHDLGLKQVAFLSAHTGGESLWPYTLHATPDGLLVMSSPMFPTKLSGDEILKLPSQDKKYVRLDDRMLGETDGSPLRRPGSESPSDYYGIAWWDAYERPASGERFRVYGCDHE